jgi:hypothetical protein
MVNIQMRKIKGQHEQSLAIENDKFVVVTNQVVGGAGDGYPGLKETHLQGSKMFLTATINVRDERRYLNASRRGSFEFRLNVRAVKPKNGDLDRFFGFLDGRKKRSRAIARLQDQLHRQVIQNTVTLTFTPIS